MHTRTALALALLLIAQPLVFTARAATPQPGAPESAKHLIPPVAGLLSGFGTASLARMIGFHPAGRLLLAGVVAASTVMFTGAAVDRSREGEWLGMAAQLMGGLGVGALVTLLGGGPIVAAVAAFVAAEAIRWLYRRYVTNPPAAVAAARSAHARPMSPPPGGLTLLEQRMQR